MGRVAIRRFAKGFTLIELMIVVAILAIVAAVAMPAYFDSVRKSRRADAIQALNLAQQAQERFRANRPTFGDRFVILTATGALSGVALSSDGAASGTTLSSTFTTPNGHYVLSLPTVAGDAPQTTYRVLASAQGSQQKDTRCRYLQVNAVGGNITYASGDSTAVSNTVSANNLCWRK